MYAWVWHRLPGPALLRLLLLTLLLLAIVALLFTVVFPWLEPHLPLGDVTLDPSGAGSAA